MTPRNTGTGGVLERMVLPALDQGRYTYRTQVEVGRRLGTGVHLVDAVVQKPEQKPFLVSVKWQQVSGTAEQKVPFEIICLIEAIEAGEYEKAYLVLGGEGWKLREVYVAGALKRYIIHSEKIEILTLESFVGRANQGKL
jgi:hypothetical protein